MFLPLLLIILFILAGVGVLVSWLLAGIGLLLIYLWRYLRPRWALRAA